MIVEKLTVEHFAKLRVQAAQRGHAFVMADPSYQRSLCAESSFAAVDDDGKTAAIAGVIDLGAGRALAWSWMGDDLRRSLLSIHNAVRLFLDTCEFHRVEMHVDPANPAAIRWARLLGFEFEARLERFYPDGRPMLQFSRLR